MFSVRNVVVVAMMQIGVIVAGVLGAGLWHKFQVANGVHILTATAFLFDHGVFGFVVPVVWSAFILMLNGRQEISDAALFLAFWLGVMLLLGLTMFVIYADFFPFFRTMRELAG